MGLFENLDLAGIPSIDWEMTPEYSFGTFESWGGVERVRSGRERIYYFFIDNWGDAPRLCLMERGIKHAKVVAEILAPKEMVKDCVKKQGKAVFDKNYAINQQVKHWILDNILETDDDTKVVPVKAEPVATVCETGLPDKNQTPPSVDKLNLPYEHVELSEDEMSSYIVKNNMYDRGYNAKGGYTGYLVDNGDSLTVTDISTGLMWQRGGIDIMSHRMMAKAIAQVNDSGFAGHNDWRQPGILEALSVMRQERNVYGAHLHFCFSEKQPFIFVNATRKPGGYWFVDYKQAKTFWASGTIPGAFGRLCRQVI